MRQRATKYCRWEIMLHILTLLSHCLLFLTDLERTVSSRPLLVLRWTAMDTNMFVLQFFIAVTHNTKFNTNISSNFGDDVWGQRWIGITSPLCFYLYTKCTWHVCHIEFRAREILSKTRKILTASLDQDWGTAISVHGLRCWNQISDPRRAVFWWRK
jgi:hypothetical protein